MALGVPGDLVSFSLSGTTTYGIVVGSPDTTHNTVAYSFLGYPTRDRALAADTSDTTSVTVLQAHG